MKPTHKGRYKPKNKSKYKGDVNNIIYRSSWELTFMKFLDNNPFIIEWGSEILSIPYIKPTTGRVHKYYPDFWVKYENKSGEIIQELVEVKPLKQTKQPTTKGKSKKTQLIEALEFGINKAKWKQAKLFCDKYGLQWRLVTEKDIYK